MTIVVPNVGETVALKAFLNNTAPQDGVLKLFKSNTTPSEGDTAGTFDEGTFTGYSSAALAGANWSFTAGDPSIATYSPTLTFKSSATQTAESIYGFYVVQTTSGILMWAERFSDGPYTINFNGDNINITLKLAAE